MAEHLGEIEGENLHLHYIHAMHSRDTPLQFFNLRNLAEARAEYIPSIFVALPDVDEEYVEGEEGK